RGRGAVPLEGRRGRMTGTMRAVAGGPGCPPAGAGRSFWDRVVVGWHAVFLGLVGLCVVLVGLNQDLATRERVLGEALLAGLAGWYLAVGRRGRGGEDPRLGILYLAGLFPATFTLVTLDQSCFVLLFAVYPQIWGMLPRTRDAIAGNWVFTSGLCVVTAGLAGWTRGGWLAGVLTGVVSLVVSALMGLWITGIVAESEQRAVLIGELRQNRDALTTLSPDSA